MSGFLVVVGLALIVGGAALARVVDQREQPVPPGLGIVAPAALALVGLIVTVTNLP